MNEPAGSTTAMAIRQLFLRASAAAAAATFVAASRLIVAPIGIAYVLTGAADFSSAPKAFDERNDAQITNAAPVSDFENGMSPSCFVSSGAPCSTKTQSIERALDSAVGPPYSPREQWPLENSLMRGNSLGICDRLTLLT